MKKPSTAVRPRKLPVKKSVKSGAEARARALHKPRIALAMAGGGPLGAIYEIGALTALSEALENLDLNALDLYIGVSAGGILGAGLANGITPREMCARFIESEDSAEPFDPAALLQPAFGEYWQRARSLPPLLAEATWRYLVNKRGRGFFSAFQRLSRAIPTGMFSNRGLQTFLAATFNQPGRSDDFRKLKSKLLLIATDLDSGHSVQFGAAGHDHVPISLAATASSALPGLFPPVEIDGRFYLDGALKRTLHASVALKDGADLVLCLNPIVPYDDSVIADAPRGPRAHRLIDGGLPVVLSQTVRAVIHSRMEIGMRQYADDYPHADVLLFEPSKMDGALFFTNLFSYSSRRRLCEHAYQQTRAELWQRRQTLQPVLARHGIKLNLDVLRDASLTLVKSEAKPAPRPAPLPVTVVTTRLGECLDDLERFVRISRAQGAPTAA